MPEQRVGLVDLELFYNKCIASLKSLEAKRSYKERTIFDFSGKRMRRKLEKGYLKGVNDALKILAKKHKEYIKAVLSE